MARSMVPLLSESPTLELSSAVPNLPSRFAAISLATSMIAPKFDYKLKWMERLYERTCALIKLEEPFLLAGDFNIIPQAEDCWDTKVWESDAAYLPESRAAYRKILNLGLTDAFRVKNKSAMNYTFWDYQAGAWNKNNGIRIDHFLLSSSCADILIDCQSDRECRARDKPSDHVPVWVELDI